MLNRPLVPAALALIGGLILGRYVAVPAWVAWTTLALALPAFLYTLATDRPRRRLLALGALCLALGVLRIDGVVRPDLPPNHVARYDLGRSLAFQGVVDVTPVFYPDGGGAFVAEVARVANEPDRWEIAAGKVRVTASRRLPDLRPGDPIQWRGRLRAIAGPRTPGVYDLSWMQIADGVYVESHLVDGANLRLDQAAHPSPARTVAAMRAYVRRLAERSSDTAWLVRALVLGERGAVDRVIDRAFDQAGIGHVLVISGLHISAVAGLIFVLVWFLLSRSSWLANRFQLARPAALIATVVALTYVAMVGGQTSALRAGVMFCLLLASFFIMRRRDVFTTIAIAALVVLLVDPGALWQAGFQFTFAAVLGMAHWRGPVRRLSQYQTFADEVVPHRWWARVRRAFIFTGGISVAAFLATAPICLWHFGALALVAPVANLVAVPVFSSVVVPLLLIGTIAAFVSPALAHVAWRIAALAVEQVHGAALVFPALGIELWHPGRPSVVEIALYAALFVAVPYLQRRRVRQFALVALVALLALPLVGMWRERRDRSFSVTMLDVGQGMALVLRTPQGAHLLIDGGYDPLGRITAPYLSAAGVTHLDVVISTHPHPDHFVGLGPVLAACAVGEIWTIEPPHLYEEMGPWLALMDEAARRDIPIRYLTRESPALAVGGITARVINPPPSGVDGWNLNDLSLALRFDWHERSFLVATDMEGVAERTVLAVESDLCVDLLQVAHHGSRTSSSAEFVRRTAPQNVLVPVGFQNRYLLPARSVMARWSAAGAKVWRTDRDGTIRCQTHGEPWLCRDIGPIDINPLLKNDKY